MDAARCLSTITPDGAAWYPVPVRAAERRRLRSRLRALAPGTTVVLVDHRFGARRRSRRTARDGCVTVERELLAIPSVEDPAYAVEDAAPALRAFWRSFATVPPGEARGALAISAVCVLVAVLRPWAVIGAIVPGRFTIGRRQ
jgi:hypothetical protein